MKARTSQFLFVLGVVVVCGIVGGFAFGPDFGIDAIGFQDDTGEPCLGDADPSFACGGEDGSDGGVRCFTCFIEEDSTGHLISAKCERDDVNGGGESCTAHISATSASCSIPNSADC